MYRVASLKRGVNRPARVDLTEGSRGGAGREHSTGMFLPGGVVSLPADQLLLRLAPVVHVHAHHLAAVFPLAGHEVEVRLIGLRGHAARRVVRVVL